MIYIAGLWELGWNTPIKEVDLWEHPLKDFSVDRFYMCPVSGINNPAVQEHHDLGVLIEEYRTLGIPIVFVDERAKTPLQNFVHPENVLYVFGKSGLNPLIAYGRESDLSVVIETPRNLGALWPHQAAAVILYDRMVKLWQ